MRRWKDFVMFIAITCILMSGYYFNSWGVADPQSFINYQVESSALVFERIVRSDAAGVFSDGGLLGLYSGGNPYAPGYTPQVSYERFVFGINQQQEQWIKYASQNGLQGISFSLLSAIANAFHLDQILKLQFFWFLTAGFLAIMLAVICLFFYREFGIWTLVLSLPLLLFSKWLTLIAKDLYWVYWTCFLPMVTVLLILCHEEKRGSISCSLQFVFVLGAVFIRVACGYEYTSSVLLAMVTPIIYFAVKYEWGWRKLIRRISILGGAGVAAFIISQIILAIQYAGTDWVKALGHMLSKIAVRTGLGTTTPAQLSSSPLIGQSLEASHFDVVKIYLEKSSLFSHIPVPFITIVVVGLFAGLILLGLDAHDRKSRALVTATWFSLLAPLSWFILAKPHSFIHTHINYVLWYLPFVMLSAVETAVAIRAIFIAWSGHTCTARNQ